MFSKKFLLKVIFEIGTPCPFHARFQNFSGVMGHTQVRHSRKFRKNWPGGYYQRSRLTSFFFLLNLWGTLPCLMLWQRTHRLIRLSLSSASSGCSFSSCMWCTWFALAIFFSFSGNHFPSATAFWILALQSWHSKRSLFNISILLVCHALLS